MHTFTSACINLFNFQDIWHFKLLLLNFFSFVFKIRISLWVQFPLSILILSSPILSSPILSFHSSFQHRMHSWPQTIIVSTIQFPSWKLMHKSTSSRTQEKLLKNKNNFTFYSQKKLSDYKLHSCLMTFFFRLWKCFCF